MRRTLVVVAAAVVASIAWSLVDGARADDKDAPRKPAEGKPSPAGVQWFATWDQGLREAKRTGRPILLIAAAPHCHDVSGLW